MKRDEVMSKWGRPLLLATVLPLLVGPLALPVMAGAVRLPTRKDATTVAPGAETILNGNAAIETRLPGPVTDRERVTLSLGPDGKPLAIVVDQRLAIHGTGDFSFKVPGPAQDVRALSDSEVQPGLRKGSVIWQGFAAGKKKLAARMPLFPGLEATRLPLATTLRMTAGGSPLASGTAASGPFHMSFSVSNQTSELTQVATGRADKSTLASILDAIGAELKKGERPVPGKGGIPKEISVAGSAGHETRFVEMAFRVSGGFVFPAGEVDHIVVKGGKVVRRPDGVHVRFRSALGGGSPRRLAVEVSGVAHGLTVPKLAMTAVPAPPSYQEVAPPQGRSWRTLVAARPGAVSGGRMLGLVMEALWQTAKLTRFDAYLGNPDPLGPSQSVYLYKLAVPEVPRAAPVSVALVVSPWLTAAALLALVLLLLNLTLLWSLS
jgi:hypothetical protein